MRIGNINLLSGQMTFPSTQNPSGGANILDDYEEGTWSPVLKFGGSATGITYATQSGYYTKIGNFVFFQLAIALTSKGAETGSATISIPIVSKNTGDAWGGVTYNYVSFAIGTGRITNGATIIQTDTQETAFADNSYIIASGFYMTE